MTRMVAVLAIAFLTLGKGKSADNSFRTIADTNLSISPVNISGGNNVLIITNSTVTTSSLAINGAANILEVTNSSLLKINGGTAASFVGNSNVFRLHGNSQFITPGLIVNGQSNLVSVESSSMAANGVVSVLNGSQFDSSNSAIGSASVGLTNGDGLITLRAGSWSVTNAITLAGLTNSLAPGGTNQFLITDGASLTAKTLQVGRIITTPPKGYVNIFRASGPATEVIVNNVTNGNETATLSISSGAVLRTKTVVSARGGMNLQISDGAAWYQEGAFATSSDALDAIVVSGESVVTNSNTTIGNSSIPDLGSTSPRYTRASLIVNDSTWASGSNFWVGLNCNGNSVKILGGATVSAQNAMLGSYNNPLSGIQNNNSFSGFDNELLVSGPGSSLILQSVFSVGNRSSSNRVIVADGGLISANSGDISFRGRNDLVSGPQTNSVSVQGANSRLKIASDYSAAGSLLEIQDGGLVEVGADAALTRLRVRGANSLFKVANRMQITSANAAITEGAHLRAAEVQIFGAQPAILTLSGLGSLIEADAVNIRRNHSSDAKGRLLSMLIADSGELRTPLLTLGIFAPESTNIVTLSGGILSVTTPAGDGLVEIENGSLLVGSGSANADQLSLTSTNASLETSGLLFVGTGQPPETPIVRIGREASAAAKLRISEGARLQASTVVFDAQARLTFTVMAPTSSPTITSSNVVLAGNLEIVLAATNSLHTGDSIRFLSSASISGQFSNAPDRSRVPAGDGSFQINYTADGVTLSDFRGDAEFQTRITHESSGQIILSFPTASAPSTVRVESSTNLTEWIQVEGAVFQTVGNQSQLTLAIELNEPSRFYRLQY